MWISVFMLLNLLLARSIDANANDGQTWDDTEEDKKIFQKYIELDKSTKEIVNYGAKMVLPYIMEANEHISLSSSCTRDIFQLISGIRKLKLSALRFLDATAKIHPGFMTGNMQMLGDYDQCMNTNVLNRDGNIIFKGKYCMLHIRPLLPRKKRPMTLTSGIEELIEATKNTSEIMRYFTSFIQLFYVQSMKFGLCVPSGCSSNDVNLMIKYLNSKAYMNATVAYCDEEDYTYTGTYVAIAAFSMVGLLVLIGTSMEYYSKKKKYIFQNYCARLLQCFSLLTNFPKIISCKTSDKSLASLHGIRSLSLFYIILLHDYFCLGNFVIHGHMMKSLSEFPKFFKQIQINGFLATEVFFFLGGFVNAHVRMKVQNNKHTLNFGQIIIHRLWRLYPAYLFSILANFLFTGANGPMRMFAKRQFYDKCAKYWWRNVLFINNFFPNADTCMINTWYIAADMQLFLLSLFTIPVLLKSAKRGLVLHVGVIFAGITATALWAWHKNIMPALIVIALEKHVIDSTVNAYTSTLPHIAPYFTGIVVGYILSVWKDLKISTIYQVIGWPVAATSFISMLFMTARWNSGIEYTQVESSLYFAFSRFLFILAVAWLVVCCVRGYGGILNYILSLNIWIIISRLSYMVYLISLILQIFYFTNLKMEIDYSDMVSIWRYVGTVAISCLMGLAMVVTIESPFISMEKIIFQRKSSKKEENLENNAGTQEKYVADEKLPTDVELGNNIKNTNGIYM